MNLVFTILALVAFWAAVSIFFQIVRSRQCLDDKTIRDYLSGKYQQGSEDSRRVTMHLGNCQKCRDRLTNFDFEEYAKKVLEEED